MSDLPSAESLDPQPLDIQHDTDPESDHGLARRIPHLGHAILFFSLAVFCLIFSLGVVYGAAQHHYGAASHFDSQATLLAHPGLALIAQALAYLATLGISLWLFPRLWNRSFFAGVHWNAAAVRRYWKQIVLLAILASIAAQLAQNFVASKDNAPIDDLLSNAHLIGYMALFAIFLGPFMEELAFRGFLLPAIATAYDWLSLERSPAALDRWQRSTAHTAPALVFSAIVSSVPFALLHAAQIGYAWGVVGILYLVSLTLSLVRIRTKSLACSTLMHAVYNSFIFVLLFVSTSGFRHLEKIGHTP